MRVSQWDNKNRDITESGLVPSALPLPSFIHDFHRILKCSGNSKSFLRKCFFLGSPRQPICEARFWQSYIHELVPTSIHTAASFFTDKQVAENCLGKAALEGKIKMHSYKKLNMKTSCMWKLLEKILLENWQRYQFGDRLLFWLLRFQPKSIPTNKERNPHGMQKHVNKDRW